MNLVQIRLYDLFREELNLSDEKAAAFVFAIEEVVGQEFKSESKPLPQKMIFTNLNSKLKNQKVTYIKPCFGRVSLN